MDAGGVQPGVLRQSTIHPVVQLAVNEIMWYPWEENWLKSNSDKFMTAMQLALDEGKARQYLRVLTRHIEGGEVSDTGQMMRKYLMESAIEPCDTGISGNHLVEGFGMDRQTSRFRELVNDQATQAEIDRAIVLLLALPADIVGIDFSCPLHATFVGHLLMFLRRRLMSRVFTVVANPSDGWTMRSKMVLQKFVNFGVQEQLRIVEEERMIEETRGFIATPPPPYSRYA